jgi:hypothetical protein
MSIPQLAIDRYLRLRHKSDDLFAARREAHEAWMQERGEVGRLDSHIRSLFPSVHVEVDGDGIVSQIEFVPGQPRQVGHAFIPVDGRHRPWREIASCRQRRSEAPRPLSTWALMRSRLAWPMRLARWTMLWRPLVGTFPVPVLE